MTRFSPYFDPFKQPVNLDLFSIHILMECVVKKTLDANMCKLAEVRLEGLVKSVSLVTC